MLIKQGTACAVEGDIKVAMAMGILKVIAGTGQLSEMYSIDFEKDICIIGHSGSGDADISQARKPTTLSGHAGSPVQTGRTPSRCGVQGRYPLPRGFGGRAGP
jgi:L-arabinose isomerase